MKDILELTHEERWLYFGGGMNIMESPPPLRSCRLEPGQSTRVALSELMDLLEGEGLYRPQIRAALASMWHETDHETVLSRDFNGLPDHIFDSLIRILRWTNSGEGLSGRDFDDGGARFLKLVLRKRPHTIQRLIASTANNTPEPNGEIH